MVFNFAVYFLVHSEALNSLICIYFDKVATKRLCNLSELFFRLCIIFKEHLLTYSELTLIYFILNLLILEKLFKFHSMLMVDVIPQCNESNYLGLIHSHYLL
jgi:hypothetical protein